MAVLHLPRDRDLELGFLSPHNPYDRRAFSGSAFFAARALMRRDHVRLRVLGHTFPPGKLQRFLGKRPPGIDPEKMKLDGLDAIVGLVATPLLNRIAELRPDLPLIHVTDATPNFLRDAYGWAIPAGADTAEIEIAGHAAATVYSSDVMARRAPLDLGLPGLNASVIPFGVNFEDLPELPAKPSLNRLNLLFVGIDWVRKGGDIAVAALDLLRAGGRDATLTVVGRCPEWHRQHPAITAVGFLDKNRPRDRAYLSELYSAAHLLLLPSRGDCTPMVVAEAMAHATPVLATDTGGIGSLVGGSGAGRLLPLHASPERWAAAISGMTSDPEAYRFLSEASFDRARNRLCWDNWAAGIEMLARHIGAPVEWRERDPKAAVRI